MNAWADNPQAAQIDALIERAARLTGDECDRLATDADAARYADRVAASSAARDAAKAADRDLVAVRVAARDAVGVSVRDREAAWVAAITAETLAVRDLIDEATPWNQKAYDVLTGPWRRVIGPVHPDDGVSAVPLEAAEQLQRVLLELGPPVEHRHEDRQVLVPGRYADEWADAFAVAGYVLSVDDTPILLSDCRLGLVMVSCEDDEPNDWYTNERHVESHEMKG